MADRLTIRVSPAVRALLAEKSEETGLTHSELVRAALDSVLAADDKDSSVRLSPEPGSGDIFPPQLADLLPRYKAFGTQIWPERRRLFQSLLAAAEIARRNGQQYDASLYAELVRVGSAFGLLTK